MRKIIKVVWILWNALSGVVRGVFMINLKTEDHERIHLLFYHSNVIGTVYSLSAR